MDQSPAGPGYGTTPVTSPNPSTTPTQSQQQPQPIVRVMRLYKPGMHCVPSFVHSPTSSTKSTAVALSSSSLSSREAGYLSDFAISPFLLLPDSFGDIYMGETFSAYVAVVNGMQDASFHHISLNLRLLATNATYDLQDTRPLVDGGEGEGSGEAKAISGKIFNASSDTGAANSAGKTLDPNALTDAVVSHALSELGTHTLRVSVQYLYNPPNRSSTSSSELKTLRKFYRFNVLQPLVVASSCVDLGLASSSGELLVQVRVTNSTQSAMFLERVVFNPSAAGDTVEAILVPESQGGNPPPPPPTASFERADNSSFGEPSGSSDEPPPMRLDTLPFVLPGESYAFAFRIIKSSQNWRASATLMSAALRGPVGHPVVTWSSYMGERGTVQGDPTFLTPQDATRPSRSSSSGTPTGMDGRKRAESSSKVGKEGGARSSSIQPPAPGTGLAVLCLHCPSTAVVGREFTVSLLCKNQTSQPAMLYLQSNYDTVTALPNPSSGGSYNSGCNGLCVTGLIGATRGTLQPGETLQTSVTVFALACGLFELSSISAVDRQTGAVYPAGCLGRVMVYDDEEGQ